MPRRSFALPRLLLVLGILSLLAGITGLVLARLGETTWAPETEHVASVTLKDPGPAVVIDPGVLYAGGHEGTVTVKGPGTVSVIPASPSEIDAYLGDAHHTRITGVPDWSTLSTKDVNPDGPADLSGIAQADLWPQVQTAKGSTATVDVADFWKAENEPPQPYRAILLVTDGTQAGASTVTITWPSDHVNGWVPTAYAAGLAGLILGLGLIALSLLMHRRARARASVERPERRRREGREGRAAATAGSSAAVRAADTDREDESPRHDEIARDDIGDGDANRDRVGPGEAIDRDDAVGRDPDDPWTEDPPSGPADEDNPWLSSVDPEPSDAAPSDPEPSDPELSAHELSAPLPGAHEPSSSAPRRGRRRAIVVEDGGEAVHHPGGGDRAAGPGTVHEDDTDVMPPVPDDAEQALATNRDKEDER